MELILVRHARAFERDSAAWPDDSRRPLTAEGRSQFVRLAKRLRRLCPKVGIVESSGFVRAWQTSLLLAEHARWPRPARLERLECGEGAGATGGADGTEDARIAALVRTVGSMRGIGRAAWVGHEPMLSRLASSLLAGGPDAVRIDFKKGAALALRIDAGEGPSGDAAPRGHPRAELLWMLTPGMVARMRRRN